MTGVRIHPEFNIRWAVRTLAKLAIPLSILPLVGAGFLYLNQKDTVRSAAAATKAQACHRVPVRAVEAPAAIARPRRSGAVPVIVYLSAAKYHRLKAGEPVSLQPASHCGRTR